MRKIRIYCNYLHVDRPWGGANNFVRALRHELEERSAFEFVTDIEDEYDILFMNQLSMGPARNSKKMKFRDVRRIMMDRKGWKSKSLVVRAINLKRHAFGYSPRSFMRYWHDDRETMRLVNFADFVIFQSEYQKSVFDANGYVGDANRVVHNGASADFETGIVEEKSQSDKLQLVSVTATPRLTKRHDIVARLSEFPGVEVIHVGMWPSTLNPRKVRLMGVRDHREIREIYRQSHFFVHAAVKDPCPNVLFEAISAGLPVIYNCGVGSSAEIVRNNGIGLTEGNLPEVVRLAKELYPSLLKNIRETRDYYSIARAAAEYGDVFQKIAEMVR